VQPQLAGENTAGGAFLKFFSGWGELQDLGDLPLWRKLLLLCCAGLWLLLGIGHLSKEADIYASAPHTPVTQTKHVYPVCVNHGYWRYLTKKEAEDWEFWNTTLPPLSAF
jgi:hypothetical protein